MNLLVQFDPTNSISGLLTLGIGVYLPGVAISRKFDLRRHVPDLLHSIFSIVFYSLLITSLFMIPPGSIVDSSPEPVETTADTTCYWYGSSEVCPLISSISITPSTKWSNQPVKFRGYVYFSDSYGSSKVVFIKFRLQGTTTWTTMSYYFDSTTTYGVTSEWSYNLGAGIYEYYAYSRVYYNTWEYDHYPGVSSSVFGTFQVNQYVVNPSISNVNPSSGTYHQGYQNFYANFDQGTYPISSRTIYWSYKNCQGLTTSQCNSASYSGFTGYSMTPYSGPTYVKSSLFLAWGCTYRYYFNTADDHGNQVSTGYYYVNGVDNTAPTITFESVIPYPMHSTPLVTTITFKVTDGDSAVDPDTATLQWREYISGSYNYYSQALTTSTGSVSTQRYYSHTIYDLNYDASYYQFYFTGYNGEGDAGNYGWSGNYYLGDANAPWEGGSPHLSAGACIYEYCSINFEIQAYDVEESISYIELWYSHNGGTYVKVDNNMALISGTMQSGTFLGTVPSIGDPGDTIRVKALMFDNAASPNSRWSSESSLVTILASPPPTITLWDRTPDDAIILSGDQLFQADATNVIGGTGIAIELRYQSSDDNSSWGSEISLSDMTANGGIFEKWVQFQNLDADKYYRFYIVVRDIGSTTATSGYIYFRIPELNPPDITIQGVTPALVVGYTPFTLNWLANDESTITSETVAWCTSYSVDQCNNPIYNSFSINAGVRSSTFNISLDLTYIMIEVDVTDEWNVSSHDYIIIYLEDAFAPTISQQSYTTAHSNMYPTDLQFDLNDNYYATGEQVTGYFSYRVHNSYNLDSQPYWSNWINDTITITWLSGSYNGIATYSIPDSPYGSIVEWIFSGFDVSLLNSVEMNGTYMIDTDDIPPSASGHLSESPNNLYPVDFLLDAEENGTSLAIVEAGYALYEENALISGGYFNIDEFGVIQDWVPAVYGNGLNYYIYNGSYNFFNLTEIYHPGYYSNYTTYQIEYFIPRLYFNPYDNDFNVIYAVVILEDGSGNTFIFNSTAFPIIDKMAPDNFLFNNLVGVPNNLEPTVIETSVSQINIENGTDWGGSLITDLYLEYSTNGVDYIPVVTTTYDMPLEKGGSAAIPAQPINMTVFYRWVATDSFGNIGYSQIHNFTVLDTYVPIITGNTQLTGTSTNPTSFTLVITDAHSGVSSVILRYKQAGDSWSVTTGTLIDTSTYSFSIPPGSELSTMYWQVEAFDYWNNSAIVMGSYIASDSSAPQVSFYMDEFSIGESGSILVNDSTFIPFARSYTNPVVFVTPTTDGDNRSLTLSQNAVVHNISDTGFWLSQSEDGGQNNDGNITESNVQYVVLESGSYRYNDYLLHVGTLNNSGSLTSYSYPFSVSNPVVLVTSQTTNNNLTGHYARLYSSNSTSFTTRMEMGDNQSLSLALPESIGFIVLEASNNYLESGTTYTDHTFTLVNTTTSSPTILASVASTGGPGYAVLRNVSSNYFEVAFEEPNSLDGFAFNQQINWIAFPSGSIFASISIGQQVTLHADITDASTVASVIVEFSYDGENYSSYVMNETAYGIYSIGLDTTFPWIYVRVTVVDSHGNVALATIDIKGA